MERSSVPGGYSTMFLLVYLPGLWLRVTDEKVLTLMSDEMSPLNLDPHAR